MCFFKKKKKSKAADKDRSPVYHVTKRAEDGKWQIKATGAEKAVKLFDTQAEAEKYAKELSKNTDRGVVTHKKDGKIKKK